MPFIQLSCLLNYASNIIFKQTFIRKYILSYLYINSTLYINSIQEPSSALTTQFHIVRRKLVFLFLRNFCSQETEQRDIGKLQSISLCNITGNWMLCYKRERKYPFLLQNLVKILRNWHNFNWIWLRMGFGGVGNKKMVSSSRLWHHANKDCTWGMQSVHT